eukprot:31036-Pelagococcus_subviridis.AAC.6
MLQFAASAASVSSSAMIFPACSAPAAATARSVLTVSSLTSSWKDSNSARMGTSAPAATTAVACASFFPAIERRARRPETTTAGAGCESDATSFSSGSSSTSSSPPEGSTSDFATSRAWDWMLGTTSGERGARGGGGGRRQDWDRGGGEARSEGAGFGKTPSRRRVV